MTDPADAGGDDWRHWRRQWRLREGTTYLNHGSFGPPPEPVRAARRAWIDRLDEQPMDFFVRTFEPALHESRACLAEFIGAAAENVALVENATYGMNVVAASVALHRGDRVLLTDHEYGAVEQVWQRACSAAGATVDIARLPLPLSSAEEVVQAIVARIEPHTRLLVVSHITSPTGIILPIESICAAARQRGVAVCVDGPHAPAQVELQIDRLDCDYYTASCHKWLSAPFGSGFLYVHPRRQADVVAPLLSWGRILPAVPERWDDWFTWTGTRDPSPLLTIPAAIAFLRRVGLSAFRARSHALARYARSRLTELVGAAPVVPDSASWYGSMALVELPPGDTYPLQRALWDRFGIEVPIIGWNDRRFIRASCHLYNTPDDVDRLVAALEGLVSRR